MLQTEDRYIGLAIGALKNTHAEFLWEQFPRVSRTPVVFMPTASWGLKTSVH